MNSRERILAAIQHKQPDRVPLDLGATPSSGISVVAHKNLLQHMGMTDLRTNVYDVVQEVAQPEMKLLDHFGVDVIDIGRYFNQAPDYWHELELIKGYSGFYPKWFNPTLQKDGSWLAANNLGEVVGRMPSGATFFDQTVFPYQDGYPTDYSKMGDDMNRTVWGAFGFTPWDWISHDGFWEKLREKTIEVKSKTNKAILIGVGCNLFEWGTFLRRMDNFLMDLYLSPEEVHRFLDAIMERHLDFLDHVCSSVGDLVDIIKFGDDLGTNNGPFIPVETYDEFFFPRHKQMCDFVKNHSSAATMLHSCGGIYELIPRLIEARFDILNPVQINAVNMDPGKLKNEFGRELTFWGGGVDTKSVLNLATPQEVKEHVKRNLDALYVDGGFVFNTVHNIMPDVPPQNIVAMYEAIREI
ncbi:uroporphyrinogen decarboxylase family protein [Sunxiuqinia sp. A32]|uniref:uroporphyrinogen decarboxylase family protein n=1 Tax=Sunxiuqinia sp. A32 TaxID=3461496 RepID=UPI004046887D